MNTKPFSILCFFRKNARITAFICVLLVTGITPVQAFCGFYVAQAGATIFNEASQVIMVRNGDKTTITMANDFKGSIKDFAMVVPVPVILQEKQIRIADNELFRKFDSYSGPRLVEYRDEDPCRPKYMEIKGEPRATTKATTGAPAPTNKDKALGVTVEAKYQVGEYDILILSAKESSGLETWLTENGYTIPKGAQEVLQPYIKSNMKFFVVKVNLEKQATSGFSYLRPIQISFQSEKFMLPIRLGMANSKGSQDLVIFSLTEKGRVETTNYRTVKMPAGDKIPVFIKNIFGEFYKSVFSTKWKAEGRNISLLEYAWNLDSRNYMKCDPCSGTPPALADLKEAGVDWLKNSQGQGKWGGSSDYEGDLFFTRLHLRYNRADFPQDLTFQETPNKENFQCRYVMQIPFTGQVSCENGTAYMQSLPPRRTDELNTMYKLTGWKRSAAFQEYIQNGNTSFTEVPKSTERGFKAEDNDVQQDRIGPKTTPPVTNPVLPGSVKEVKNIGGEAKPKVISASGDTLVLEPETPPYDSNQTTIVSSSESEIKEEPKESGQNSNVLNFLLYGGIFMAGAGALIYALRKKG